MADITTLTDSSFDEAVLASDKPLVVDFWAEWCGPCKMIAPILEELSGELGESIAFAKLNVDEAPEVARRNGVMSIPTLIVFRNGEPAKRIVGAKSKTALVEDLADFL